MMMNFKVIRHKVLDCSKLAHYGQAYRFCTSIIYSVNKKSIDLQEKNEELVTIINSSDSIEAIGIIEEKRNKSQLESKHYRILHKLPPDLTEDDIAMRPLTDYRKRYGTYGTASGSEIFRLWPSHSELEHMKEYEKVAFPHTIQDMIQMAKREKAEKEEIIMMRQKKIEENMKKLHIWKKEVRDRIAKKEAIALVAMKKKEEQIDAVRKVFGFKIDTKDPRFQEALVKKEEEEKKASKQAKKLKRQQLILEKFQADIAFSVGQGMPIAGDIANSTKPPNKS